jgi:branched-chain amino acid transport system substrate-binding protein
MSCCGLGMICKIQEHDGWTSGRNREARDDVFSRFDAPARPACRCWLDACSTLAAHAAGATRGVSDTEIVIGTMTDLSGVTAVQGTNNANAIRMAFDGVNAKGGIHGRKIHYVVEDMEYQVPKSVQAMNKLLNRDDIFFALASGGTPMNEAVMPVMLEKNVPTSSR